MLIEQIVVWVVLLVVIPGIAMLIGELTDRSREKQKAIWDELERDQYDDFRRSGGILYDLPDPPDTSTEERVLKYVMTVDRQSHKLNRENGKEELHIEPFADVYEDEDAWVIDYSTYGIVDIPNYRRAKEHSLQSVRRTLEMDRTVFVKSLAQKELEQLTTGLLNRPREHAAGHNRTIEKSARAIPCEPRRR